MSQQWFVKGDGKNEGPFAAAQLKQLADTGRITPAHLVCQGTDGTPSEKWAQAAKVKGLFAPRGAATEEAATTPQSTAETSAQVTESKPTPAPPPTSISSDVGWHTGRDGQKAGPFTLTDLLKQPFPDGTLVWHPSLTGWTVPAEVEELKAHVAHSPPPLNAFQLEMSLIEDALVKVREIADGNFCVTIEPIENKAKDLWVQFMGQTLNFNYPFSDEPMLTLHKLGIELPSGVTLSEWEANLFVAFEHSFDNIPALSRFVHQYMEHMVLALELPDYEILFRVRED